MKKEAFSMFGTGGGLSGPTLGTLEHKIMMDTRIDNYQKQFIIKQIKQEVGTFTPSSTPLSQVIPKIGGGVLGYLIAKYFNMSLPGQIISTAAGYGIGKVIADFYTATANFAFGNQSNRHMLR